MFNFYNFRIIVIALSIGLLLTGCSTNKTRDDKPYKEHIPTTPLHTAIIKLEREGLWTGFGHTFKITDNEKNIGRLKDGSSLTWHRPPGEMNLRLFLWDASQYPLTIQKDISAGKEYRFEFKSNGYLSGWQSPRLVYLGSKPVKMVEPTSEFQYPQGFKHEILGSNAVLEGFYFVKEDIKIGNLRIRRVRKPDPNCNKGYANSQYIDHIEIDGEINEDTSFIVDKMLNSTVRCKYKKDGPFLATIVFLNSFGGTLDDGYQIGRIFKERQVSAKISYGQVCASSCAIAFLGARYKSMSPESSLILHAPYIKKSNQKIHCADEDTDVGMRDYLSKMLGKSTSDVVFNRTMKYCSEDSGWTVNRDAAKIYGMLD
jgi:ATP-dependent protease ClpP protease subunit